MVFYYAIYYDIHLIHILYLLVNIISLFHRLIYISMNHLGTTLLPIIPYVHLDANEHRIFS